jgi:hypothetical protein
MISKVILHYLKKPVAVLSTQDDIQAFASRIAREKYIVSGGDLSDKQHTEEITFRNSLALTVGNTLFRVTHCELIYKLDDLKNFRRSNENA